MLHGQAPPPLDRGIPLLGLGIVLSYSPQSGGPSNDPSLLKDATANGKKLDAYIFPEHQPKLPGMEP